MKLCKDCTHRYSNEYVDECRFPSENVKTDPVYGRLMYPYCITERSLEIGSCGPEAANFAPREKSFLEALFS